MQISSLPNAFNEGEGQLPIQQVGWYDDDNPKDIDALREVVQNVERSRNYVQSHGLHAEWDYADKQWEAHVPASLWPNKKPKSNLGVPLVQSHTTTLLNQITNAFFADPQPFQVDPKPGTAADAARANQAILQWELDQTDFPAEFELFALNVLLYGTGIAKIGWEITEQKVRRYRRKGAPITVSAGATTENIHPPDYDEIVAEDVTKQSSRPFFINQNLKYVLVDPQLRVPNIQKAEYAACVDYWDVNDLDCLREQVIEDDSGKPIAGYKNILPREVLEALVVPHKDEGTIINPLETGQNGAGIWGRYANLAKAMPRWEDTQADPGKKPFMVVEYYTRDRCIVVLQNQLVIRNDRNPYGRIPFVSSVFVLNSDSFYGKGIARLIGHEQALQQGSLNQALNIEHLRIAGAGAKSTPMSGAQHQEMLLSPGRFFNVQDVTQFKMFDFPSMLPDAEAVMASSDARSQRLTGANQVSVQGQMPVTGSNLFRTKTGIDLMTGGTDGRMQALVDRISNLVFVPTLELFTFMNAEFLSPSEYKQILSEELAVAYEGDPFDIIRGEYRFKIMAGSRLRSQKAMANLPFIMQFYADPNVLNHLGIQGKTFDFYEWIKMASDQMELPNLQSLIRPMTAEEKQAYDAQQQTAAQQAQMDLQKIQTQGQIKSQMLSQDNEEKSGRDLIRDMIKNNEVQ